jgi:hypothetical protein
MFKIVSMERFCTQTIKIPFPKNVFFNNELMMKIPKSGDAISRIQLVLDLQSENVYKEEVIKQAELVIDGFSIEKVYGEFLHIENQFLLNLEKKDFYSNLVSGKNVYLDLPFYAVKKKFMELNEDTWIRILFTEGDSSEIHGHLLVDYVVIDGEKPKEPYVQRTRKISRLNAVVNSCRQIYIDTYIPGSVYELFFTVRDVSSNSYVDAIKNIKMDIGENERFNLSGYYLKNVEPIKIYNSTTDEPFYMYSFRIKNDVYVPSGHTNLKTNQRFTIDFYDNDKTYLVTIWAQSHDFYYKNKTVKQIFDSEEYVFFTSTKPVISYQPIDLKTSYVFYLDAVGISYTSDVEIQSVTVTDTNIPTTPTITQNEINFNGLDSSMGEYYANVVFEATGFKSVTCNFTFKSPMTFYNFFNSSENSTKDYFSPSKQYLFIDGNQRVNSYTSESVNGVPMTPSVSYVRTDQYRNYFVTNTNSVKKYDSSLNSVLYSVSGYYFGKCSSYFGLDVIPSSNVFYVYSNNSLVNTKPIQYCKIVTSHVDSESSIYVCGTTFDTSPIVFDSNVSVNKGTGIKSFIAKYDKDQKYVYSIIIDECGSITSALNDTGPVLTFSTNSNTTLYASDYSYNYSSDGVSVVQCKKNGVISWSSNSSGSSLTVDVCSSDIFYNVYASYYKSTNYYIKKIDKNGNQKWSKTFTFPANSFTMNVFFEQDVTAVSYGNNDPLNRNLIQFDIKKNVPGGMKGTSFFDSEGNILTPYSTPVSNLYDFTSIPKDPYYKPLYSGLYFSNTSSYYTSNVVKYWGFYFYGDGSISPKCIDVTNDAKYFTVTGQYGSQPEQLYPHQASLPANEGGGGVYLIKSNVLTSNIEWTSHIDSIITSSYPYNTTIDKSGNIYFSGAFGIYRSNIFNSDGAKYTGYLPQLSNNDRGAYIVKYDNDGYVKWHTYMNRVNDSTDYSFRMASSYSNVYIIAEAYDNFSPKTFEIYDAKLSGDRQPTINSSLSAVYMGGLLVKYDTNGTALWKVTSDTNKGDWRVITLDSSENIWFSLSNYEDPYSTYRITNGDGTLFSTVMTKRGLVKLNTNGIATLAFYIGCGGIASSRTDSSDNLIVTGGWDYWHWPGNIEFYEWNGSSISDTGVRISSAHSNGDGFMCKYNSSGQFLWRVYFVHLTGQGGANARSSAIDPTTNDIYLYVGVENYQGSQVTFFNSDDSIFSKQISDNQGGVLSTYIGLIVKYNSSGMCQWITKIFPINGAPTGSIIFDKINNHVIVNGTYQRNTLLRIYDSNDGEHVTRIPDTSSKNMIYCVKFDSNGFLVET